MITSTDTADEDWSRHEKFSKDTVECMQGHVFASHSKFSGRLIAIISRTPCPVCGDHSMRSAHSSSEVQSITAKDAGNAEDT